MIVAVAHLEGTPTEYVFPAYLDGSREDWTLPTGGSAELWLAAALATLTARISRDQYLDRLSAQHGAVNLAALLVRLLAEDQADRCVRIYHREQSLIARPRHAQARA